MFVPGVIAEMGDLQSEMWGIWATPSKMLKWLLKNQFLSEIQKIGFAAFGSINWIGFGKLDFGRSSETRNAVSDSQIERVAYGVQFFGSARKGSGTRTLGFLKSRVTGRRLRVMCRLHCSHTMRSSYRKFLSCNLTAELSQSAPLRRKLYRIPVVAHRSDLYMILYIVQFFIDKSIQTN